jgi:acyl-coenzyme A thioesterase PaaI-like protein
VVHRGTLSALIDTAAAVAMWSRAIVTYKLTHGRAAV